MVIIYCQKEGRGGVVCVWGGGEGGGVGGRWGTWFNCSITA